MSRVAPTHGHPYAIETAMGTLKSGRVGRHWLRAPALLPRSLTWEALSAGIQAFLVTRQILCGAGKFGWEEEDKYLIKLQDCLQNK